MDHINHTLFVNDLAEEPSTNMSVNVGQATQYPISLTEPPPVDELYREHIDDPLLFRHANEPSNAPSEHPQSPPLLRRLARSRTTDSLPVRRQSETINQRFDPRSPFRYPQMQLRSEQYHQLSQPQPIHFQDSQYMQRNFSPLQSRSVRPQLQPVHIQYHESQYLQQTQYQGPECMAMRSPSLNREDSNPFLSPDSSFSDISSLPSSVSQAETLVSRGFRASYSLPLGQLPSVVDCISANQKALARIPIRKIPSSYPHAIHRHFFIKETPDCSVDDEISACDTEKKDRATEVYICQVMEGRRICGQKKPEKQGSAPRMNHIRRVHSVLLDALNAFRAEQARVKGITLPNTDSQQSTTSQSQPSQSLTEIADTVFSRLIPALPTVVQQVKPRTKVQIQQQKLHSSLEFRQQTAQYLAGKIALHGYPFSILGDGVFEGLMDLHGVAYFKCPKRDMVIQALTTLYGHAEASLARLFKADVLAGSYTCDGWSCHGRKFIGLTFHFVQSDYKTRSVTIGLEEYDSSSTAVKIRSIMRGILDRWHLTAKVISGTTDQGANIKAAAMNLFEDDVTMSHISWLPCVAHKMQLCVKKSVAEAEEAGSLLEQAQKLSSLLQTHNGSMFLKAAQKLLGTKEKKAVGFTETRWNSYFIMAERIVDLSEDIKQMMETISCPDAPPEVKRFWKVNRDSFLCDEKFRNLKEVIDVLRSAMGFTKAMSGDHPAVTELYPRIYSIINEGPMLSYPGAIALRGEFVKQLGRDFDMKSIPDSILIATFLNPAFTHHPIFSSVAKDDVSDDCTSTEPETLGNKAERLIFQAQKRMLENDVRLYPDEDARSHEAHVRHLQFCITEYKLLTKNTAEACQEYKGSPERWWFHNHHILSSLAPIARVYLSVQATSVASERLFSAAGNILTDKRANLSTDVFTKMVLFKSIYPVLKDLN